jgi:hypothetical protein
MTEGRKIVQLRVKKMTTDTGWEFFWLFAVCDDGTIWERMWNTNADTEHLWAGTAIRLACSNREGAWPLG